MTLEGGTNRLSQNVGDELPIYAVWHLRREKNSDHYRIMSDTTEKDKKYAKLSGLGLPTGPPGPSSLPGFLRASSALSVSFVPMHILILRSTRTCLLFSLWN